MIDVSQLSPWLWVAAPLVVVFAYVVFGITGFGATAISVPLLAHFLPITYLVPLTVLLDMSAAIFVGTQGRESVNREELKRLVPFMLLGFVLGVTVLVHVDGNWLRVALGLFAVAVGVYGIANPVLRSRISTFWCVPAGVVGGSVATVFGAGGPVYATYLSGRIADKDEIRATISTLISLSAFARALLYAIGGLLLHWTIFAGVLVLAPFVWLGLWIGGRVHVGLTQAQMRRLVGILLVLAGASLLLRSLL